MTFVIKQRGAPTAKLADFRCPAHDVFEALVDPGEETAPCPECGTDSPWTPSPVAGHVAIASVTTGKRAAKPHRLSMDVMEVGSRRSLTEWRKERSKMFADERHRKRKDEGRF